MDERIKECLQDILEQAKEVLEFTKGMTWKNRHQFFQSLELF